MISYVASKGKPIILSTGIATVEDIELALKTCKEAGNNQITLLKCTSSYPAPIEEANLVMIRELAERYEVATGLSDHTLGITAPIVAVTQGAKVIEKHFILDKSIGGPDASFSLDVDEFTQMVKSVRELLGNVSYSLTKKQQQGRKFSRSLYVVKDVKKGDILNSENVRSIRPGYGLHPKFIKTLLGKRFKLDIKAGERLSSEIIE